MKKQLAIASALVIGMTTLSGCTLADGASPKTSATAAPLFNQLPPEIQKSGVISVASLDDLPPWVFADKGEHTGIDVDLTNAMADLLGVKFNYTTYAFPTMIPGLQANRFDLIINEIGDNADREKAVSFVDYSQDYTGIIVPTGNPKQLTSLDQLCGLKLAVVQGSFPETQANTQSKKCVSDGKSEITLANVPTPTDTYLAVASGRADATLNGYSTSAYAISKGGITNGIELAKGKPIQPGLNGLAFNKDNTKLGAAIQAALQQLMDNGSYKKILDKWGVSDAAIPKATINNAAQFAQQNPGS